MTWRDPVSDPPAVGQRVVVLGYEPTWPDAVADLEEIETTFCGFEYPPIPNGFKYPVFRDAYNVDGWRPA